MLKLSDRSWRSFYLKDLFEIVLSKGDNKPNELEVGDIPLVSAGNSNNGVVKFIDEGDGISEIFSGNCITVDMFGKAFYQKNDFYSVSHGRVNILIPKFELTEKIGIFLVTYFDNRFLLEYSFGRMCTSTQLANEVFDLPIKPNTNDPDWDFIENYMVSLEPKSDISTLLELLKDESPERISWFNDHIDMEDFKKYLAVKSDKKLDVEIVETVERERVVCNTENKNRLSLSDRTWYSFPMSYIFSRIITGKDLIYNQLDGNDYPVIGHGVENNGVVCRTKYLEDYPLQDHTKCLSMAHIGNFKANVQLEDFYLGTRVKSLVLKDNISHYAKLFLAEVINSENYKYDYSRVGSDKIPHLQIYLPSTSTNTPDWEFMDRYMKQIECELTV